MLTLASASPRRREILRAAGLAFRVRPADVDESPRPEEAPADCVLRLAEAKARAVWRAGETTLGADTVVSIEGRTLGKPADPAEAERMLRLLSGKRHEVVTGFCLFDGVEARGGVETTAVFFAELDEEEIARYVASGEPLDKAGAYGIQGRAAKFIERIEGCYFNVVGLPVARIYGLLRSGVVEG